MSIASEMLACESLQETFVPFVSINVASSAIPPNVDTSAPPPTLPPKAHTPFLDASSSTTIAGSTTTTTTPITGSTTPPLLNTTAGSCLPASMFLIKITNNCTLLNSIRVDHNKTKRIVYFYTPEETFDRIMVWRMSSVHPSGRPSVRLSGVSKVLSAH